MKKLLMLALVCALCQNVSASADGGGVVLDLLVDYQSVSFGTPVGTKKRCETLRASKRKKSGDLTHRPQMKLRKKKDEIVPAVAQKLPARPSTPTDQAVKMYMDNSAQSRKVIGTPLSKLAEFKPSPMKPGQSPSQRAKQKKQELEKNPDPLVAGRILLGHVAHTLEKKGEKPSRVSVAEALREQDRHGLCKVAFRVIASESPGDAPGYMSPKYRHIQERHSLSSYPRLEWAVGSVDNTFVSFEANKAYQKRKFQQQLGEKIFR